ncbi:MAG: PAS domain S-box protein [Gammaproteobacteria bacterium]
MQNVATKQARTQKTIVLSVALVLAATVLAGLAGSALLTYYNHHDFHNGLLQTVRDEAAFLKEVAESSLLASAGIFDSLDTQAIEYAWLRGDITDAVREQLARIGPLTEDSDLVSVAVLSRSGQMLGIVGDGARPLENAIPLTRQNHAWLYWDKGWRIEHHMDILVGGVPVAKWIARIKLHDLDEAVRQVRTFVPGSIFAVCALRDDEYPCLSMPTDGTPPRYFLSENGLCLADDCEGGARETGFSMTHGIVAAYQVVEGLDVMMVYSIPLPDFFRQEQRYERAAIIAVLLVALSGLWVIYLQARPIARDLARTTIHMHEIMSKLPESVITIDKSGVICTANPATERMFGYTEQELIGSNVHMLMPEPHRSRHDSLIKRYRQELATRGPHVERSSREVVGQHKDGTVFPVELSISEYWFGDEPRFIGIIRDIRPRKRYEETLHKWAHIFAHAEWGIVVVGAQSGVLELMNPAFARMHGYTVEELAGRPIQALFAPEFHADIEQHIRTADARGHYSWEVPHRRKDGSSFIGLVDITAVKDGQGGIMYRVMNVRDITTRKQAEESLKRSQARLANAQRIARLGDWEWDIETGRMKWSDETWRLLGLVPGEFEPTYDILAGMVEPEDREAVRTAVDDALRDGRSYSIDYRIRRADGAIRVFHEEGEVVCTDDGRPLRRVGTLQDITEMKQRELELERQRAQLRELAANRETVREQERTRVAREIHDELGQSLTSLRMKAALIGLGFGAKDPLLGEQIDDIKALIDQTIIVVRNVASKLRPGALDLGIISAVEWLAQDFEERTGILCGLDLDPDIELKDDRATMVFRILQESLTNVARHAEANHVEISLKEQDGFYCLEVSDDGKGFDMNAPAERKTFGLLGIQERAMVLGGELSIASSPGAGTMLKLRIPV